MALSAETPQPALPVWRRDLPEPVLFPEARGYSQTPATEQDGISKRLADRPSLAVAATAIDHDVIADIADRTGVPFGEFLLAGRTAVPAKTAIPKNRRRDDERGDDIR